MLRTILKINTHINDALRGQYARICAQVNVEETLKTVIHIGHHIHGVVHEGINIV